MVFQYNIVTLLKLIEERPCLWNRSSDEFKDKILKRREWIEVFRYLEKGYDDLNTKEKNEIERKITAKWVNIRDSFLRSLRTRSRPGARKSYLYAQYLQFLLKRRKVNLASRKLENTDKKITYEHEIKKREPISSPDEHFFMSFVPYIKDMTENEKIDLQINILNHIRQIKNDRLNSEHYDDDDDDDATEDPLYAELIDSS